ncbi:BRO-N domain-containing protein [Comamonas kerstersii]|uniref:BRO-N domain-containing protein n=1 Tax=Comamonas kerstersii TaxID=225992 RepID=UPI000987C901|nr:Bro-N domain-containing protein [Comamonas kerstersii]
MAEITPFNFGSNIVRVVSRNNDPWFVANDVCKALGYSNTSKAIADHLDDDERYNESLDRGGSLLLISESGLYALILRSRKTEARKFAKWVTSEVLPTIRKTGSYQSDTQSQRTALAHQLASQATAQVFDTVFRAVMDGSFNPSLDRLLLSFTPGGPNGEHTPQATTLPHNAIVTTVPHLIRAVASDLAITTPDLTSLALACTQRLASRTCRQQGVFS